MKNILFLLIAALALYACQKEISGFNTEKVERVSFSGFFKKTSSPLQSFSADPSSSISFTTAKGTKVRFPENAFLTLNNGPVSGAVSIEIKEIFTPGDMILNNTPTMSNGEPLLSAGEFFVRISQNNQRLKLGPGKYIRLDVVPNPGADVDDMQVFDGDTSGGTINWIPDSSAPNRVVRDSISSAISLFGDNLDWINIDKFFNEPQITYTVNPGNSPNRDSTAVFIHLTGLKSVLRLQATGSFSSNNMIAAPATLVGICVLDGVLYYSMLPVVMQNGGSATLTFESIGEKELKQKLAALK